MPYPPSLLSTIIVHRLGTTIFTSFSIQFIPFQHSRSCSERFADPETRYGMAYTIQIGTDDTRICSRLTTRPNTPNTRQSRSQDATLQYFLHFTTLSYVFIGISCISTPQPLWSLRDPDTASDTRWHGYLYHRRTLLRAQNTRRIIFNAASAITSPIKHLQTQAVSRFKDQIQEIRHDGKAEGQKASTS